MDRFEVRAVDGHRFAVSLHAAASPTAPLLLFMAALGVRARYYEALGKAFAEAGISFASYDWRGMDSSSLRAARGVDWGYRELLETDLPATVAALRSRLPGAPLWLGGHSLGGQLAALHAARAPEQIVGVVAIASGTVHFRAWRGSGALRILALTQTAPLIARAVGHFPGRRIGFGGQEARGLIADWSRVARSGRYRTAGSSYDYESAMQRLEKPVLALGFSGDRLAPRGATDALLAKLPRCARSHWRWRPEDSGGVAFDHFNWAKHPQLIVPAICAWMLGAVQPQ